MAISRSADAPTHAIVPLDPARHDRAHFASGVAQVDNFLRRTANKLEKAGNSRTFVLVGSNSELVGYYATNAHAVRYTELPDRFTRDRPAHGNIPAAYISMIGVDRRHQGRGFGGVLLADCLKRLAHAADVLGIAVVMLDVLDRGESDAVARRLALYTGYGFAPLPHDPLRLFIPMSVVRRLVAETPAP